jgi:hypothetical protein
MNQVIRNVERSIGARWVISRRSLTCRLVPASAAMSSSGRAVSTTTMMDRRRDHTIVSSPITQPGELRSSYSYSHKSLLAGTNFNFSSASAATDATTGATSTSIVSAQDSRPLSALQQQANLELLTPGQAIYILQRYAAKGTGNLIRQSDFIELCNSSRPGKLRDALIIATALKEFKRNNRFVLKLSGSKAAVEGMLRSRMPTWKVQDGKPRVKAALFVAEQILNEDTGLYYAIETVTVDQVLEELHKGLIEMKDGGFKVTIDSTDNNEKGMADEGSETLPPSPDEKLISDALRVTQSLIQLLIKRKSRPEWDMKKRAARRYLKRLQIGGGPYRSTLQVATKISCLIGGSAVAQQHIIDPFERAWWTKFVDEETLKLIQEAKELEEQAILISAAIGEEYEDVESEIDEGDESNVDEAEDELTNEEDFAADTESGKEKKD